MTGYHRKALIRARHRPERRPVRGAARRGRRCHYTDATARWGRSGRRRAAVVGAAADIAVDLAAVGVERFALTAENETQLRAISARQMVRVLAADKPRLRRQQYWGRARARC